ncbi:hypothetical protein [Kibdelosporangium aridum]|uniref:HNH endonuclease n=1 Tax=Kibdelosporangium aridum TaxID=2030 RepID=A0A1W2DNK9_KIBAR|nr:hypothetical protein [Kibdelosporangium aridum]SMC99071.1 hypothetical protein SAMN05661093_03632 [Kibdelosporangium aridum]
MTTRRVNHGKGDRDASDWKPPRQAAWCEFATAYILIKIRYRLSVDHAELHGLRQMMAACPA